MKPIYRNHVQIKDPTLKDETLKNEQKLLHYIMNEPSTSLLFQKGPFEINLIMYASYKGWMDMVRYLYQERRMSLEKENSLGRSALFYLCMTDNLLKIKDFFDFQPSHYIRYFQRLSLPPNMTILMYLASQGFFELTSLLLNCSENILKTSENGFSLLEYSLMTKTSKEEYQLFSTQLEQIPNQTRNQMQRLENELSQKVSEGATIKEQLQNLEGDLTEDQTREKLRLLFELDQISDKIQMLTPQIQLLVANAEKVENLFIELGPLSASLGHPDGFKLFLDFIQMTEPYSLCSYLLNFVTFKKDFKFKLFKILILLHFYPSPLMKQEFLDNFQNIHIDFINQLITWLNTPNTCYAQGFLGQTIHPSLYELFQLKNEPCSIQNKIIKRCQSPLSLVCNEALNLIDVILTNPFLAQEELIALILKTVPQTKAVFDPSNFVATTTLQKMFDLKYPLSQKFFTHILSYVQRFDSREQLGTQLLFKTNEDFIQSLGGFSSLRDARLLSDSKLAEFELLLEKRTQANMVKKHLSVHTFESWLETIEKKPDWFFPNKEGEPIWNQIFNTSEKDTKMFSYCLVLGRNCINQQNKLGQTGLMVAVQEWEKWRNNVVARAKTILRNPTFNDNSGEQAVEVIFSTGNDETIRQKGEEILQMIQHLIAVSKNLDWTLKDCKQKTLLHYAIEAKALKFFKIFVNAGAPLHWGVPFKKSYLYHALIHCEEISDYLLTTFPFLLENTGKDLMTPLRHAVVNHKHKQTAFLIPYQGGLHRTFDSKTLLDEALLARNFESAFLLFEAGLTLEKFNHPECINVLKERLLVQEDPLDIVCSHICFRRARTQKLLFYLQRSA